VIRTSTRGIPESSIGHKLINNTCNTYMRFRVDEGSQIHMNNES